MNKINHLVQVFFKSPLIWGIFGSVGFYGLIFGGPLDFEVVKRYFAKHPIEYMETVLFAIGLASLILKAVEYAGQRSGLHKSPLGPKTQAAEPVEASHAMLQRLDQLPYGRQGRFFCPPVEVRIGTHSQLWLD